MGASRAQSFGSEWWSYRKGGKESVVTSNVKSSIVEEQRLCFVFVPSIVEEQILFRLRSFDSWGTNTSLRLHSFDSWGTNTSLRLRFLDSWGTNTLVCLLSFDSWGTNTSLRLCSFDSWGTNTLVRLCSFDSEGTINSFFFVPSLVEVRIYHFSSLR